MTKRGNIVSLTGCNVSCKNCSLASLCLPKGLAGAEIKALDKVITRRRPLGRREHLFHAGEGCKFIYAVRSGAVKTWVTNTNGDERVIGFHLPGELVGVDALDDGRHSCTATALDSTSLCRLPYERLSSLCAGYPNINAQVHRLIGEALAQANAMLVLLGKKSAGERMASFLLNLSTRLNRRGFSHREFSLSMTRRDMGNYLGLALGTVCRLLTELQQEGVLSVRRRHIQIHDIEYLRALVGWSAQNSSAAV
jgi:CRP/FNR family transcriptional regulator